MKASFLILFIVFISFISFSEDKENKKDLASDEVKKEMDKVFLDLTKDIESCKGDLSRTIIDTLKNSKKEIKIEKLMISGDTVSYSMIIRISEQTETRSIIRNRTPEKWYGYRIEKNVGYKKERYQEGYINNTSDLDSLLIPIKKEYALVKEYKEKNKQQGETLVKK